MAGSSNPFSLLGLPERFDLSPDQIHAAHLSRVATIHPDLNQQSAPGDVGDDGDPAAALNDAKRILENPESRANALLRLLGGPSKEADRSLPPGFLMDMMATREAIEAATKSRDSAEADRWRRWADAQRAQYSREISEVFHALPSSPSNADLAAIRTRLNAWRYIERLIEQLDPDYHGLSDSSPA